MSIRACTCAFERNRIDAQTRAVKVRSKLLFQSADEQDTLVFKYTPQNNLRATSFIFPLIITKMRSSSFKIFHGLEVSALFQSAQHVRKMFSYKSVNGTNNARLKDSKKNGKFQNNVVLFF